MIGAVRSPQLFASVRELPDILVVHPAMRYDADAICTGRGYGAVLAPSVPLHLVCSGREPSAVDEVPDAPSVPVVKNDRGTSVVRHVKRDLDPLRLGLALRDERIEVERRHTLGPHRLPVAERGREVCLRAPHRAVLLPCDAKIEPQVSVS